MSRILLIEDDPNIRKAYTRVLTIEKFEVEVADNGKDGLKKAREFNPDLIILDMLMPEMDGIEFLEAFNVKENGRKTKIVVLSNVFNQDKIERAIQLGAVNYKSKALFSPRDLIDMVRETLKTA